MSRSFDIFFNTDILLIMSFHIGVISVSRVLTQHDDAGAGDAGHVIFIPARIFTYPSAAETALCDPLSGHHSLAEVAFELVERVEALLRLLAGFSNSNDRVHHSFQIVVSFSFHRYHQTDRPVGSISRPKMVSTLCRSQPFLDVFQMFVDALQFDDYRAFIGVDIVLFQFQFLLILFEIVEEENDE